MSDLRDFLLHGCSAREEDRHHAVQELDALQARLKRLTDLIRSMPEPKLQTYAEGGKWSLGWWMDKATRDLIVEVQTRTPWMPRNVEEPRG